jgi:hypothetical protein
MTVGNHISSLYYQPVQFSIKSSNLFPIDANYIFYGREC